MMEEKIITCPYCWESIHVYLEPDIGEEKICIIEDCSVCCRPIELIYGIKNGNIKLYDYHEIEGNRF
ncbi:CPXCG motif-containing cysteine-rich protein [Sulfurospirillum sp. 1612]|uniref:CPXCG motif-containing cysteine-rich protein n=1 Tax=Sulfurospirillum sp. 1612 TaxID=3094835 RepID=UPI002F957675